jgi:Spy/CpxP family protein refolding chaperone
MSYKYNFGKKTLAALLLSTALVTAPALAGTCYAHDGQGWSEDGGQKDSWADHKGMDHAHFTDAQRQLIHSAMQKLHETNKPLREELHQLHGQMHDVMQADPFDQQAFLSLTDKIDAKRGAMKRNREQAFASIAGQFPPQQRKHLAHIFLKRHKHHHGHHHHGMQDGWNHDGNRDGGHGDGWHHGDREDTVHSDWQKNDGAPQELNDEGQFVPQNSRNSAYPPYQQ